MNVIEEIFFGELNPNGNYQTTETYDKAVEIILNIEEKLMKSLSEQDKKLFIQYINAHSTTSGTESVGYFTLGFKLGAKLMAEIYEN